MSHLIQVQLALEAYLREITSHRRPLVFVHDEPFETLVGPLEDVTGMLSWAKVEDFSSHSVVQTNMTMNRMKRELGYVRGMLNIRWCIPHGDVSSSLTECVFM